MLASATMTCSAQAWTNVYGALRGAMGAKGLAVDRAGNIFVTGSSATNAAGIANYDYATIKYSSTGVPLWTNTYDGLGNAPDFANAVAVSGDGNVFVTGAVWSGINNDFLTIAYSGSGTALWTNRYNGPADRDDTAVSVVVDTNGNVFVTGTSGVSANNFDIATIKYSSAGTPLWTNRYHGPSDGPNESKAMALHQNGNVFVTGRTINSNIASIRWEYVTIGYSNNGVALWTNRFGEPGGGEAMAIAVDNSGNVIVTGESAVSLTGFSDFATIKYSSDGAPLWTNRYNGPGNNYDGAKDIAVDASNNVFVTGESIGSNFYSDFATVKYSAAGVPLWTNRYNGSADYGFAQTVATDASGNVFVAGTFGADDAHFDCATVAYSGEGVMLWEKLYNGGQDSDDGGYAVAVDAVGNVIIAGITGADAQFLTIKYVAGGPWLSIERQGGSVVLSWTNAAFGLQSSPSLGDTFTNISGATSPYTNPVSGSQRYFRLKAN